MIYIPRTVVTHERQIYPCSWLANIPAFYHVWASVEDPWHFDTDPDPAIFITDLQDAYKKLVFLLISFWRYIYFTSFLNINSQKEVTKL